MEEVPKMTSLYELGEQLFSEAAQDVSGKFKIEQTQWPDGRTVEAAQYQAGPVVNVRVMRPGIDTSELIDVEEDTEHSDSPIMEMSILCERRFHIGLESGERYTSDRFYIGIFNQQAYLLTPVLALKGGGPYIDGWRQQPLSRDSEWWLQDLIKPQ